MSHGSFESGNCRAHGLLAGSFLTWEKSMPESIALAGNVYNDAHALRGALETGARFFDNFFFVHSGPNGAYSTDGTIELLEKFGATVVFDDISKGYGVIRTRCL